MTNLSLFFPQALVVVDSLACINMTRTRLRSVGTSCTATVPTPLKHATFPTTQLRNGPRSVSTLPTTDGAPGIIARFLTFVWVNGTACVATLQFSGIAPKDSTVKCNTSESVPTLRKKAPARQRDVSFRMSSVQTVIASRHRRRRLRQHQLRQDLSFLALLMALTMFRVRSLSQSKMPSSVMSSSLSCLTRVKTSMTMTVMKTKMM